MPEEKRRVVVVGALKIRPEERYTSGPVLVRPEVRFHNLRHTAATQAIRQGLSIHSVAKMLGHSDPTMTLRRYAHVLDEMRDDAAEAMDDLF